MADIDQIIAGGAGASSRADFSNLFSGGFDAYNKGRDEKAKNDLREAFKGGVPTTPEGQPDFGAMAKVLFQKGGLSEGTAAANLGIAQQNQQFGQGQSSAIQQAESGGQPVSPPSSNRTAGTVVAPPLNRGGVQSGQSPQGQPTGPQGGATVMQVVAAQGIPNDQLGAVSASVARQLGVDPTAPIDLNDPQVRNVLVPAIAQIKKMGVGQVVTGAQPGPQPIPPQVAQQGPPGQPALPASPQQPVPQPQIAQQAPGLASPATQAVTSTAPVPELSRIDKMIAFYSGIMSDPRSPKQNVELAKTRLDALQKNTDLTPDQKNYAQAVSQGYKGTMQDFAAETESRKTASTEEAKLGAQKYQTLVENGTKAQMEIPQLDLLKEQMNDPNFFSGSGEKYNLLYKRLKSAVGIDPDAAVPQEYLRKATAANVLSSLGQLKGLGQIRVAEINMAREAAASPDNSIPANKLLVEISKRTHQRNADIADMAQAYKEQNGTLDPGFDKQVTAYYKKNPLFTDSEIKDWHSIIGEQKTAGASSASPPIPNARKAPDGNWYVPDPARQGKYLKVNM